MVMDVARNTPSASARALVFGESPPVLLHLYLALAESPQRQALTLARVEEGGGREVLELMGSTG